MRIRHFRDVSVRGGGRGGGGGLWIPSPEFFICGSILKWFYLEWKMFDLLDKKMQYDLWVVERLGNCDSCGKTLSDKLQRL